MRSFGPASSTHSPPATLGAAGVQTGDWGTLQRLFPYLWAYKWRVVVALSLMVGAKVANVGVPLLLKTLVDNLTPQPDAATAMLVVPLGLLVAYAALRLSTSLLTELRDLVRAKAAVIDGWVAAGRMAPVDSVHLFFTIWAATQTYADFDVQVCAVLNRSELSPKDHARATEHVVSLLLRGCGFTV